MEIYAEISRKTLYEIEELGRDFIWPDGVKWSRRWGSTSCYLECDSENKRALIDFLEYRRIPWQLNPDIVEGSKKQIEKAEKRAERQEAKKKKGGGFREFRDPWAEKDENN